MAGTAEGQRKGVGRPRVDDRRASKVDVRVSGSEARTLAALAQAAGLRLRDYVRRAALGARIVAPLDPVSADHAARLVAVGQALARIERLAIAGRIVGVPPGDLAELRRLAEAAAVRILGADDEEGDTLPCSP